MFYARQIITQVQLWRMHVTSQQKASRQWVNNNNVQWQQSSPPVTVTNRITRPTVGHYPRREDMGWPWGWGGVLAGRRVGCCGGAGWGWGQGGRRQAWYGWGGGWVGQPQAGHPKQVRAQRNAIRACNHARVHHDTRNKRNATSKVKAVVERGSPALIAVQSFEALVRNCPGAVTVTWPVTIAGTVPNNLANPVGASERLAHTEGVHKR